jgi:hypothetical protein
VDQTRRFNHTPTPRILGPDLTARPNRLNNAVLIRFMQIGILAAGWAAFHPSNEQFDFCKVFLFVAALVGCFESYKLATKNASLWFPFLVVMAVLYNPIVPIQWLPSAWQVISTISGIGLWVITSEFHQALKEGTTNKAKLDADSLFFFAIFAWLTPQVLWRVELSQVQRSYSAGRYADSLVLFRQLDKKQRTAPWFFSSEEYLKEVRSGAAGALERHDYKTSTGFYQLVQEVGHRTKLDTISDSAGLADALCGQSKFAEAEVVLNNASIKTADNADEIGKARARLLIAQSRVYEAFEILDSIKKRLQDAASDSKYAGDLIAFLPDYAAIAEKAGKPELAENSLSEAVALAEKNEDYENAIEYAKRLGALYETQSKTDLALSVQKRIVELKDKQAEQEKQQESEVPQDDN